MVYFRSSLLFLPDTLKIPFPCSVQHLTITPQAPQGGLKAAPENRLRRAMPAPCRLPPSQLQHVKNYSFRSLLLGTRKTSGGGVKTSGWSFLDSTQHILKAYYLPYTSLISAINIVLNLNINQMVRPVIEDNEKSANLISSLNSSAENGRKTPRRMKAVKKV